MLQSYPSFRTLFMFHVNPYYYQIMRSALDQKLTQRRNASKDKVNTIELANSVYLSLIIID